MSWPRNGRPEPRMYPHEVGHMEDPDCGFYIHHVPLSETEPYINSHTHGVPESWPAGDCTMCGTEGDDLSINPACAGCRGTGKTVAQTDFQIVVNVGPQSCVQIFWDLVDRVKKGERFHDGERVHDILKQPILLKKLFEGRKLSEGYPGREVLRVLIPNSKVSPPTLPGDKGHDPEFFPLQATLDTENLPWGDPPGHDDVPCGRR